MRTLSLETRSKVSSSQQRIQFVRFARYFHPTLELGLAFLPTLLCATWLYLQQQMRCILPYPNKSVGLHDELLPQAVQTLAVCCIHYMRLCCSLRFLHQLAVRYVDINFSSHTSQNKESIRRSSFTIDNFFQSLRVDRPNFFHNQPPAVVFMIVFFVFWKIFSVHP